MADVNYEALQALIVDDFDSFRMTVHRMLQEMGLHQVDNAVNGAEALRHCRQKSYDLILCDYNLGRGKTGQQVLEEVRHHELQSNDTLFIMISAESSKSIIMAAYDYEPDAYLTKPITSKIFEQRLGRLLAQRAQIAPIMRAIKEQKTELAIALCRKQIDSGGRYSNVCQKLLGNLYIQLGNYDDAEAVYRAVLEMRQLDWAQIGMARVKKMQGDALSAHQWLEEVIVSNPMAMKAYDLQADIFREQEDHKSLQRVLEKAIDISPLSILRQQHLGDVAIANHDSLTAANAYRRAIKLGENSCYDRLETHTGFAHASLAFYSADNVLGKPFVRDALKVMAEIEQHFGKTPDQKITSTLIETQLLVCQGESKKANELLTSVKDLIAADTLALDFELEFELLKSMRATGQKTEAEQLLKDMLARHKGSEKALEQLDLLLEEPVSARNRQRVAEINRQGITSYDAGNYSEAVECFESALQAFPNHIGIRLNLVQALIDKLKLNYAQPDFQLAEKTLAQVAELLTPAHNQQLRYRKLFDSLRTCSGAKVTQ